MPKDGFIVEMLPPALAPKSGPTTKDGTAHPTGEANRGWRCQTEHLPLTHPRIGDFVSMTDARTHSHADSTAVSRRALAIGTAIETVIEGKPEQIKIALITLLAGGHLLIEDVPGVGKTMLAKALAATLNCTMHRVQFTPDLLPSDITGVSVYHQDRHEFEFKPGAIFANIVLGDEINRASPKTQSALLECMEESQVTVDGTTYLLPTPFMVIATQNPVDMEGTFALPEAQRDRFMARISMGYPGPTAELALLARHGNHTPLAEVRPVASAKEIAQLAEQTRQIWVAPAVAQYIVDLTGATRNTAELRLGASPRASLHLLRAARAQAALSGRDHVLPDDIQALAIPVLAHRLLPAANLPQGPDAAADVLRAILRRIPVPTGQPG